MRLTLVVQMHVPVNKSPGPTHEKNGALRERLRLRMIQNIFMRRP